MGKTFRVRQIGFLIAIVVGVFQGGFVTAQSSKGKSGVVSNVVLPNLNEILAPLPQQKVSAKPKQVVRNEVPTSSVPTSSFGDFDSDSDTKPQLSLVQPDPPGVDETDKHKVEETEKTESKQQAVDCEPAKQSQQPIVFEINTPGYSYFQTVPIYRSYSFYSYRPLYYNNRNYSSQRQFNRFNHFGGFGKCRF